MKALKDALHFTVRERRGIFLLLCFLLMTWYLPIWYSLIFPTPIPPPPPEEWLGKVAPAPTPSITDTVRWHFFDPNAVDQGTLENLGLPEKVAQTWIRFRSARGGFSGSEEIQKIYGLPEDWWAEAQAWMRWEVDQESSRKRKPLDQVDIPEESTPERFPFDPNRVGEEELLRLGVPQRVARTLLRFRSRGGYFYQKEDLLKVYGLDAALYHQLEPYIQMTGKKETSEREEKPAIWTLDINQATSEEWQELPGIGPYFAGKILRFREALGGFSSVEQVGQTYRLPDSTFQKIQPRLVASPVLRKLPINKASATELKQHPYLTYRLARAIVNYRIQHGPFSGLEDLRKVKVLDAEQLEQLAPYLTFEAPSESLPE